MVKRESFPTEVSTTLNGAITDSATTLTVTSAAGFPSDGDFAVLLSGTEIVVVRQVSGTTFTILRGQANTSAQAHANGATVHSIIIGENLGKRLRDSVPWAENKPKMNCLTDATGNRLQVSDFTWVNQGTVTATDVHDTIYMVGESSGTIFCSSLALALVTPPATYTLGCCFSTSQSITASTNGFPGVIFGARDSNTSRTQHYQLAFRSGGYNIYVVNKLNPTSGSTVVFSRGWPGSSEYWLRLVDSGGNFDFQFSANGNDWESLYTASRTNYLAAPDQIHFGLDTAGATVGPPRATFFHFSIE